MNGSINSTSAGLVEICFGDVYGSVCSNLWDERDASVVCRQLGSGEDRLCDWPYSNTGVLCTLTLLSSYIDTNNIVAIQDGQLFGNNSLSVSLDNFMCLGSESKLLQCSHGDIHQYNCDSSNVAGVICGGGKPLYIGFLPSLCSISNDPIPSVSCRHMQ